VEPEEIMNGISEEILSNIKQMGKAKTVEEKHIHSEIVRNLCESLGVFLRVASEAGDLIPYDDDEPLPF